MVSNCAAFILCGEVLLRTKELSADDVANIGSTVAEGDVVEMHGHKISHNSYNLSIECNSFKWGNKEKITVDGNTIYNDGNEGKHYNEAFAGLIKMHNERTFKRGIDLENVSNKYDAFIKVNSHGGQVVNAVWIGEGPALAMQSDEVLIYLQFNGIDGSVSADAKVQDTVDGHWDKLFNYGWSEYSTATNKINFGGERNAIVIYDAYGR